ncbi:MAG: TrkH family potassium uptake protein [Alphaproteobacteria bacterium]|nr:TrkH family potassium uptake protein [Alphaproteobacteria bacterium]
MALSFVFYLCGFVLRFFGAMMLFPLGMAVFLENKQDFRIFGISALLCFITGFLLCFKTKKDWTNLHTREMFLSTSLVWIFAILFSSFPFYFSGFSFTDSFFEVASGLSSTGASIISYVESLSPSLLLWRAMTQWIGGIGIIILAIAVLPALHIGGMQFFATENSDNSSKGAPQIAQKMKQILSVYGILSLTCFFFLWLAKMPVFDALCHMMATVSTGGFSTKSNSVAFYSSPAVHYIIAFFMFICSFPFMLIIALCKGDFKALINNTQIKSFFLLTFVVIGILTSYLIKTKGLPFEEAFRKTTFQIISVISTTGFVIDDYLSWGTFAIAILFFITPIGGCTGSTAGGLKIFRLSVLFKTLGKRFKTMITPHAVIIPRYDGRPMTDDISVAVLSFITVSLLIMMASTLILSLTDMDVFTALSVSLSSMANVGPTTSEKLCPFCSFAELSIMAKWTLSFVMILGRLEFMTLIILLVPSFWKQQ